MTINPIGVQTPKVVQPQFKGAAEDMLTKGFTKLTDLKSFQKIAKFAGDNAVGFNAATALVMAGLLRPAAVMALPAKDEKTQKNKVNAAAHSIASGVIGFAITMAVTTPLKNALKSVFKADGAVVKTLGKFGQEGEGKLCEKLFEKSKDIPLQSVQTKMGERAEKLLNFAPDLILAIPRALLTSKLSHKIEGLLFKKKDEPKQVEQPQPKQVEPQAQVAQAQATDRPVLDGFKGGNN